MATIDPAMLVCPSPEECDIKLEDDMDTSEEAGFTAFSAQRDKDDIDEDSKLLFSDEGKKLSSKERRQLRNKVSARNFRVRRKEYINHLEKLVATHSSEAQALRSQVDTLKTENADLCAELARLKLSASLPAITTSSDAPKIELDATTQALLEKVNTRCSTPIKETQMVVDMPKDINPYSAGVNWSSLDWPLSNLNTLQSPSSGTFDFSSFTTGNAWVQASA